MMVGVNGGQQKGGSKEPCLDRAMEGSGGCQQRGWRVSRCVGYQTIVSPLSATRARGLLPPFRAVSLFGPINALPD